MKANPVHVPSSAIETKSSNIHVSLSDPGPLEQESNRAGLRVISVSRTGKVETESVGTEGIRGGPITRRCTSVVWERPPKTVLVVRSRGSRQAELALQQLVWWLVKAEQLQVIVENEVAKKCPQLPAKPVGEDLSLLEKEVDFVICLGGDGLILHVCSALFPRAVPPVMSFNLGSLGFLTPFDFELFKQEVHHILRGDRNQVTLRMRLQCAVHRVTPQSNHSEETEDSQEYFQSSDEEDVEDGNIEEGCGICQANASSKYKKVAQLHVLNDVVIDRGPAPFLSNLLCYCDEHPVTRIQADGIIIATPTGSTAYSLSSGGSMVHPAVPGILFTPICPHSLSFRPVIFPDYVTLRIKVPHRARGDAWISFDGRKRMELFKGDSVCVRVSKWPVTTFCKVNQTRDWFSAVTRCLHWNDRQEQKPFDCSLDRKASPRRKGLTGNVPPIENNWENIAQLSLNSEEEITKHVEDCDEDQCKNAFRTPT
ncbi:Probable NAD kinase 2, chloroplastic [Galdieria sulphuraria]|uniref:NAD+ kinase n=1 Tax=Galdieria sulphuraria TaxID=130081 RepID=M2X7R3_GALSU|nr:NAD+ kinase [Galdieria sulphuraria]EME32585.1 NAD+ kinase [Galdieria sulphuraria]GJD12923.1 Probable NAD kinase 2, chloroplastic [Galdieria sulphuraria]|eukprot:XP_005709105.1 NAD+ kinase [Galdieria sulphuraria]